MIGPCPFPCMNKTEFGYCKTTACLYAPTIRIMSKTGETVMNCHNKGCSYNFYGTCNAIHRLNISKDGVCMTNSSVNNTKVSVFMTQANNTNFIETKDITLPYTNNLSTEIGGSNE